MHPLKGRKQSLEHIAARVKSFRKTRKLHPWKAGRPENTPEELWSKVEKRSPNDCWPWKGWIHEDSYGRTQINGKAYFAHRVIFNLVHPGAISLSAPRKKSAWGFLRHTCDNPICCNPSHLVVGTHQQNMDDKVERRRLPDYSGDKGPRCKLTMSDARQARALHKQGIGPTELARRFGISLPSMKSLLRGISYKETD